MTDVQQLTKETLALEHKRQLTDKKLDVVGAITAKAKKQTDNILVELNTQANLLNAYQADNHKDMVSELSEKASLEATLHADTLKRIETLTESTVTLEETLKGVYIGIDDELTKQELVTSEQTQNIENRVTDSLERLDHHINMSDPSSALSHMERLTRTAEVFTSDTKKSSQRMSNLHIDAKRQISELRELVEDHKKVSQDTKTAISILYQTLNELDDKIGLVAPHYTLPSASTLTSAFDDLANSSEVDDLVTLLGDAATERQLDDPEHVDDILYEKEHLDIPEVEPETTTQDVTGEEVVIENDTIPLVETPELPREVPESTFETTIEKPKKKGLFAKLFGK